MNEELQAKLCELVTYLIDISKVTGDFAAEQTPMLLQELLLRARIQSSFLMGVAVSLFCFCLFTAIRNHKLWKEKHYEECPEILFCIIPGLASFVILIIAIVNTGSFITIWFAPKVYILEYITSLAKGLTS